MCVTPLATSGKTQLVMRSGKHAVLWIMSPLKGTLQWTVFLIKAQARLAVSCNVDTWHRLDARTADVHS
jgi:hypothetical protein